MSRPLRAPLAAAALALLVVSAAQAGTVYVPLPGVTQVGSVAWETEVSIVNPALAATQVKGYLIAADADGTARTATPAAVQVEAGRTLIYRPAASFRGLLEISGSPLARYAARLEGKGPVGFLGAPLPVITSENVTPAGGTVTLAGLVRTTTRASHIGVVNLGHLAAQCTLQLVRADGTAVGATRSFPLQPLTQSWLSDVFAGLVDAAGIADARAAVSCNREHFAWALLTDSATGELSTVHPAASGESLLRVPGEQAPCPTGAVCQTSNLVFRPTPASPVGHVVFPAPVGTFTRLRLEMEVTVGDFYAADPDGKHLIYWFVINRNLDMPGMLFFRGPEAYTALARHGMGLRHANKLRITDPSFRAVPGRTYRVVHDYDMGRGVLTITITDVASGQVASTMTGAPNVAKVTLAATDRLLVDVGFKEGAVPDEVPSYNWVYSKIRVDAIP